MSYWNAKGGVELKRMTWGHGRPEDPKKIPNTPELAQKAAKFMIQTGLHNVHHRPQPAERAPFSCSSSRAYHVLIGGEQVVRGRGNEFRMEAW